MSVRRQLISDELRYSHQTSPRKVRTCLGVSIIPTILYDNKKYNSDPKDWIGKLLIPWNGENIENYMRLTTLGLNNRKIINEFDISNYTKTIYRIIYIDEFGYMKSKPSVDKVPSRLNIFLTTDNIIRHVSYF